MVNAMPDLESATRLDGSRHNRAHMISGTVCGCFHCCAVFSADEIAEWIDDDRTALCPRCGVDAVLAGTTDPATLHDLHTRAFAQAQQPSAAEWDAALPAAPDRPGR